VSLRIRYAEIGHCLFAWQHNPYCHPIAMSLKLKDMKMTIWLQSSDKIVTPAQLSGAPGLFSCNNTIRTLLAFDQSCSGLPRSAGETNVHAGPFQSGLRFYSGSGKLKKKARTHHEKECSSERRICIPTNRRKNP
jgi:hypothetical protein